MYKYLNALRPSGLGGFRISVGHNDIVRLQFDDVRCMHAVRNINWKIVLGSFRAMWIENLWRKKSKFSRNASAQFGDQKSSMFTTVDLSSLGRTPTDVRRTSGGRPMDVRRTSDGRPTVSDGRPKSDGRPMDVQWTSDGRPTDVRRTSDGRPTDVRRTSDGRRRG